MKNRLKYTNKQHSCNLINDLNVGLIFHNFSARLAIWYWGVIDVVRGLHSNRIYTMIQVSYIVKGLAEQWSIYWQVLNLVNFGTNTKQTFFPSRVSQNHLIFHQPIRNTTGWGEAGSRGQQWQKLILPLHFSKI